MTTLRLTAKCSRRSAAAGHSYCRASRAIWKRIESCARPGTTRRQRPPKRHTHTYVRYGPLADSRHNTILGLLCSRKSGHLNTWAVEDVHVLELRADQTKTPMCRGFVATRWTA